jgi:hypothetical protein
MLCYVVLAQERKENLDFSEKMSLLLMHSYHIPGLCKKFPQVRLHPMLVQSADPSEHVIPVFVENARKAMVFQFIERCSENGERDANELSKIARYYESEDECAMAIVALPWIPDFVVLWTKSMRFHGLPLVQPAEIENERSSGDGENGPFGHAEVDPSHIQRLIDDIDSTKIYFREEEEEEEEISSFRGEDQLGPSRVMSGLKEMGAKLEETLVKFRSHRFIMPAQDDRMMEALYAEGRFFTENVISVLQDAETYIIDGVKELREKTMRMENVGRDFTQFIQTESEILRDGEECLKRNEQIREKTRKLREKTGKQEFPSIAQESFLDEIEMMDQKFLSWAKDQVGTTRRTMSVLDRREKAKLAKGWKAGEKDRVLELQKQLNMLKERIRGIKSAKDVKDSDGKGRFVS